LADPFPVQWRDSPPAAEFDVGAGGGFQSSNISVARKLGEGLLGASQLSCGRTLRLSRLSIHHRALGGV